MSSEWRARLKELLKDENALHNTTATLPAREEKQREKVRTFSESVRIGTAKTAKTPLENSAFSGTAQSATAKTAKTTEAEDLGLVAAWSVEFGFISVHDPTTGEWHDLHWKDAPGWARWEARKRKELYGDGNRKAHRLTSREIGEIWAAENPPAEDAGIVEDHPIEGEG
jgi:hypothetical protein